MALECRAFGAHALQQANPDLTVGPIICRPFGPPDSRCDAIAEWIPDSMFLSGISESGIWNHVTYPMHLT